MTLKQWYRTYGIKYEVIHGDCQKSIRIPKIDLPSGYSVLKEGYNVLPYLEDYDLTKGYQFYILTPKTVLKGKE